MERLEKYTHEQLVGSHDFRAEHLAQRLAEIPINIEKAISGRKRPPLSFMERINNKPVPPVPAPVARALERRLSKAKQPLFDKFTRHYRISNPNKDKVSRYIEGVNRRNKNKSDNPEIKRQILESRQRQIMYTGDKLQQTALSDFNIARYRATALRATNRQITYQKPIGTQLQIISANALEDFGFCLMDRENALLIEDFRFFPNQNKSGGDELNGSMIGAYLAFLGQQAAKDEQVLYNNPALLDVVTLEQDKRVEYWGRIYEVSQEVLGNRLSQQDIDDNFWVDDQIKQFNAV